MQLNLMTGNVISKALNKCQKNIIYEPKYSLLDGLIFGLNYRFYIFGNNRLDYDRPNVIDLPNRLYNIYNYSMHVSHDIEKYVDNNHVAKIFHLPSIIFIDPNIKSYKKEDKYILFQKVRHSHKIFFTNETFEHFGRPDKSYVVPLGIPTEIFSPTTAWEKREKDVLILSEDIIAQQIKNMLETNGISCDTKNIGLINPTLLNTIFNQYKFCIDTTNNNYINLLCAISSGCRTIATNPSAIPCPYVIYINAMNDIISAIKNNSNSIDRSIIDEYLATYFPYQVFIEKINSIFSITSKEVFIQ